MLASSSLLLNTTHHFICSSVTKAQERRREYEQTEATHALDIFATGFMYLIELCKVRVWVRSTLHAGAPRRNSIQLTTVPRRNTVAHVRWEGFVGERTRRRENSSTGRGKKY